MSLKDWLKNGWLVEHKTSPQEITDLLGVMDRDLADCETPGLSPDWRLNIAYNAALQAATALLLLLDTGPSASPITTGRFNHLHTPSGLTAS